MLPEYTKKFTQLISFVPELAYDILTELILLDYD